MEAGPSLFLLVVAAIFLIGIAGEIFFERTGIPDVIWLILVGMILGPFTGLVERSMLAGIAPYFGALTLVIVLFDGGSELRLKELSKAAPRSSLLAVLTFVVSVAVLAPMAYLASYAGVLPRSWGWLQCLIVGTILGGSSSVVIMPALRTAGLSKRLSNLINLESAITDVLCVVATGALIQIAAPPLGVGEPDHPAITLLRSFGIGLGVGALAGLIAVLFLRRLKKSVYAYPLILGLLLILYVVVDALGGSAALGILTVAVVIGNAAELSKLIGLEKTARLSRGVESVHDQIAFIVKSFFFVFIGAMLSPPWGLIGMGVLFGLLLLVARVLPVLLATVASGFSRPAKGTVIFCMPRGMAAGVLAMMPHQNSPPVPHTADLPVVVFAAVFTTILIFAVGFPVMRRFLGPDDLEAKGIAAPGPATASATATTSDFGTTAESLTDAGAADTVYDPEVAVVQEPESQ